VQKRKPLKKIKETDAIFENVHKENEKSDKREDSLRISAHHSNAGIATA
jgi:hypothetical protein